MASKNRLDQAAGASIGGFFSKSDESKPEPEQTARESRKPPYTDEQMDEALKTVYRTGKQQDGADYLQINKGTFSKKIREIEEKEPERVKRLKTEVEAEKDTPQAPQKPETAPEPHEPIKSTPSEEKAAEKPNTKQEKRVMGFRADVNKIDLWKIYAEATEQEIGVMCTAAIDEYISNHELTADQRQIFDIKIKALEAEKRIKAKNR